MRRTLQVEDPGRRRWAVLALLSGAELLGMSPWFAGGAIGPWLGRTWGLDAGALGWLTGAVQLGFVAGTAAAALLNLADIVPARGYFAVSALGAAASNAALLVAPDYPSALGLRFLTGACLAGVYPPAMKMIATWFRDGRGLAVGTIVGALTIGKATPWLTRALATDDPRDIVLAASAGALVAAAAVGVAYRDGPHGFERRTFSWSLVGTILADRPTRLATAGYLGHMWELYAMWTWVPAFVAASFAASSGSAAGADAVAFGAIAAGGLGCIWGGLVADRIGRERLVNLSMAASGGCCLVVGICFGANPWLVAGVTWVWGFFVVADSAQFSTLVTEVGPRHGVGTALTLQTSIGFLLTVVTIQLVPWLVGVVGWRWAFAVLAAGPASGILAVRRLAALRAGCAASRAPAG